MLPPLNHDFRLINKDFLCTTRRIACCFSVIVAAAALNLSVLSVARADEFGNSQPYTTLERNEAGLGPSAREAYDQAIRKIPSEMFRIYQPVYASIPSYADDHYSVRGSYVELYHSATGGLEDHLYDGLFESFEQRLITTEHTLGIHLADTFIENLKQQTADNLPAQ